MTQKHTPGPWICGTFRETGNSAGIDIGASDNSNVALAIHQASDRSAFETKRNALLIAAAPDLLAALEDCERIISFALANNQLDGQNRFDADHSISGIRSVIAKAKGEL